MELQIIEYATKEYLVIIEQYMYNILLMQNGMEILIVEYLQVVMFLTYLVVQLVG
eukprot:Gb_22189 [translate_table: standard]